MKARFTPRSTSSGSSPKVPDARIQQLQRTQALQQAAQAWHQQQQGDILDELRKTQAQAQQQQLARARRFRV